MIHLKLAPQCSTICAIVAAIFAFSTVSYCQERQEVNSKDSKQEDANAIVSLSPYLVFPGNCREAMEFYRQCLGGQITDMTTFGDSPVQVPEESANRIYNAELTLGEIQIKASDDLPHSKVTNGTNVSMFLTVVGVDRQQELFEQLSDGGKVLFPTKDGFGMLRDKYGVQWMLMAKQR